MMMLGMTHIMDDIIHIMNETEINKCIDINTQPKTRKTSKIIYAL